MSYIWLLLLILRLAWSLLPQSGYIHPDEFFQTVEVVAGDALNVSVVRTWEFTSVYPLRSVVLPHIIFHPIFKLLKYADETSSFQVTGYRLVATCRLLMTVLSLWVDFCVYKISKVIGVKGHTANILLASSYVTLTFQTHTFSNSMETILFVNLVLLILLCICQDETQKRKKVVNRFFSKVDKLMEDFPGISRVTDDKYNGAVEDDDLDSSFNDLHKNAFNLRKRNLECFDSEIEQGKRGSRITEEKANNRFGKDSQMHKETSSYGYGNQTDKNRSNGQNNPYLCIILMALTVTLGVFNRPTFVIFAALPILWWSNKHPTGEMYVLKRAAVFVISGVIFTFIFVTMDTVYFTDIDITSLLSTDGWRNILQKCVITPLNFFLYNSVSTNLETHGRHPFYVHMLVNLPLLFGPMLRCIITRVLILMNFLKPDKEKLKENKSKVELTISVEDKLRGDFQGMLAVFVLFPPIVLSLFPHQEARFLIPLLPLVVLSVVILSNKLSKVFWTIFIIFNISLSVVFGALHQGGVIPALIRLQQLTKSECKKDNNISLKFIFSHTYMPPKHVLVTKNPNIDLIDLKGNNFQTVISEIEKIKALNSSFKDSEKNNNGVKCFLVLPGTLVTEFKLTVGGSDVGGTTVGGSVVGGTAVGRSAVGGTNVGRSAMGRLLSLKSEEKFFPHLSFEDPPNLFLIDSYKSFVDMMSLHLIEIE